MSEETEVKTEKPKVHILVKRWENVVNVKILELPEELENKKGHNTYHHNSMGNHGQFNITVYHDNGGSNLNPNGITIAVNSPRTVLTCNCSNSTSAKKMVERLTEALKEWLETLGKGPQPPEEVESTEIKL